MRKVTVVVAALAAFAAVSVLVIRKLRTPGRAAEPEVAPGDVGFDTTALPSNQIATGGIATVDPGPTTQISGEGVDLDTAPGASGLSPRTSEGRSR